MEQGSAMNRELLKARRKERGLTQDAVARLLGVAQETYSQYESGKRQPYPDLLPKIADVVGLSLDEFLRNENEPGTQRIIESFIPVEKEARPMDSDYWTAIIDKLTDTINRQAMMVQQRIELVESKDAEARLVAEQKQLQAEKNLTLALEEAKAARVAQPFSHPGDRPDEAAVAEK